MKACLPAIALLSTFAGSAAAQSEEITTFGTTVVIPYGLRGEIYNLEPGTEWLPNFDRLTPVGAIYTSSLNIKPRHFTEGFPGVTDRFEWFAIDYRGRFYIDKPGKYRFTLISDDGSKLYIDEKVIIDNDHGHPTLMKDGSVTLAGGVHSIRVSYFQGPRYDLALMLGVLGPGEKVWHVFDTEYFRPPSDPAKWKYGDPAKDLLEIPPSSTGRKKLKDAIPDKN
jgi:hypothetical protein